MEGVCLIRVEFKYVEDNSERPIDKAKEQLEEATKWRITVQNQAPFLFGIAITNKKARVYILSPENVKESSKTIATLVGEYIFVKKG